MDYSASDFRTMARENLRGKWKTAILLTIAASFLAALTLGIGSFAVAPYMETAKASFYQDLLDNGLRLEEELM